MILEKSLPQKMYTIRNLKYDIYQFAPITISCNSYSKLLDVAIKLTINGLKLDISYLEDNDLYPTRFKSNDKEQKKYHFLIKRIGETVIEDGYVFLKMIDVLSDSIDRYYIFYKEECSDEENRETKLDQLGI